MALLLLLQKEFLSDIGEEILSYIPITCEKLREQARHIDPEIL